MLSWCLYPRKSDKASQKLSITFPYCSHRKFDVSVLVSILVVVLSDQRPHTFDSDVPVLNCIIHTQRSQCPTQTLVWFLQDLTWHVGRRGGNLYHDLILAKGGTFVTELSWSPWRLWHCCTRKGFLYMMVCFEATTGGGAQGWIRPWEPYWLPGIKPSWLPAKQMPLPSILSLQTKKKILET